MNIRTRFAPSPTGILHAGGIRTALFNWLFAKKYNGIFRLRIEDTDKMRSKTKWILLIKNTLQWMNVQWHSFIELQSMNTQRHIDIANRLIRICNAYYCYLTKNEIFKFKKENYRKKIINKWRYINLSKKNKNASIRLKTQEQGSVILQDDSLGIVRVSNSEIDDMVLLRSNKTPTYLLSSVVDDHDNGVTNIIRGNDHLTNTFRQLQIIKLLGWESLNYAHIPLVHSSSGGKMSKRECALGMNEYKKLGYIPTAIFQYVLELGWNNNETSIVINDIANRFNLLRINSSPSIFDFNKLNFINQSCITITKNKKLAFQLINYFHKKVLNFQCLLKINLLILLIKSRGQTIQNLLDISLIFISYYYPIDNKSKKILKFDHSKEILLNLLYIFQSIIDWNSIMLRQVCYVYARKYIINSSIIMKVLRLGVVGTFQSPPIYKILEILGKKESILRILYFL